MSLPTPDADSGRLIPQNQGRVGDDPIFALNGEAARRARAGEAILNSTLGTLLADDLSLAVIPAVAEPTCASPRDVRRSTRRSRDRRSSRGP